jgi:hypothetical protein
MFPFKKAKTILNADREEKLTDEQVKQVLELLEVFARISVEQFKTKINEEKSSDYDTGE